MATRRETEIVWTYDYYIFLALPFLVSIILFVQALKEGHSGIFVDMWWVMVITFVVWFYIRVWPTRIKVNHKNETLTFFDGAFRAHSISAGTLKEITVGKSYLISQTVILKYVIDESQKSCTWHQSSYPRENRKKVLNLLLTFNPDVNISSEVHELIYTKEGPLY